MKKKVCMFCSERSVWADYKDANLLKRFLSERAKIRARRVTGNCARHQREVAVAIKTARELALLPYQQRQVTDRSRGAGRGRRDRDEGTLQSISPPPGRGEFSGSAGDPFDEVPSAELEDTFAVPEDSDEGALIEVESSSLAVASVTGDAVVSGSAVPGDEGGVDSAEADSPEEEAGGLE